MYVLPLPMIVSLILLFLLARAVLRREAAGMLLALLAACAVQGIVISLNQYYGVHFFALVQPITAAMIPPLAYVAFQLTAVRAFDAERDLWHMIVPLFVAFCAAFVPGAVDQAIMAAFLGYGAALLFAMRGGRDALVQTRLESGDTPVTIWRVIGVALIASGVSDALIVAAQMSGQDWLKPVIIAVGSSGTLLMLGVLGLSRDLAGGEKVVEPPIPYDTEADADLMARLDGLMTTKALYLDPDLTLAQMARRLHVPIKALSAAINRNRGENVSRYINGHRIAHAGRMLVQGEQVTQAMLASGFNTKSNFNREFLRVMGAAPTDWLMRQDVVDKPADAAV